MTPTNMTPEERIAPYIVSKGGKEVGVTFTDIQENLLTPAEYEKFSRWMDGQTVGLLDKKTSICYTDDLISFMKRPLGD